MIEPDPQYKTTRVRMTTLQQGKRADENSSFTGIPIILDNRMPKQKP